MLKRRYECLFVARTDNVEPHIIEWQIVEGFKCNVHATRPSDSTHVQKMEPFQWGLTHLWEEGTRRKVSQDHWLASAEAASQMPICDHYTIHRSCSSPFKPIPYLDSNIPALSKMT